MGTIKGQHLRLTLDDKYVALATSCTVHVSASMEDSSTKDSEDGLWQDQELVGLTWDVSTDALYSVETDETGINGEGALDLILAGQKVKLEFTGTEGSKNRTAQGNKYVGWAIVNDVSVNATNRQNASYSLQAQGCGKLEKNGSLSTPDL